MSLDLVHFCAPDSFSRGKLASALEFQVTVFARSWTQDF